MAALAGAVLACGGAAQGAQIFFSTSATFANGAAAQAASQINPVVTIPQGTTTSVFLWARVAAPTDQGEDPDLAPAHDYTSNERLVGMGIDVVLGTGLSNVAHSHANNYAINNNASRWNGPPSSTAAPNTAQGEFIGGAGDATNALTLARFKRVAVGVDGISGVVNALSPAPAPPNDIGAGNIVGSDGAIYQRFATIPLVGVTATGTSAADTIPDTYFLQTNSVVVGYNPGSPTGVVNFGAGDPSVTGRAAGGGVRSQLADLSVNVLGTVPEPGSLGLLGVGALSLIRRRKA